MEHLLRRKGLNVKIEKYIGGGANGRVYETNKGNLIKIAAGNNPMEYEALKIMKGTGITPKLKGFGGKVIKVPLNSRIFIRSLFGSYENKLTIFLMEKIKANKLMTLSEFVKMNPNFDWKTERKKLLGIIHSRGLTHGDFHLGNILVSIDKGKPPKFWAIDFGRSVRLPPGIKEKSLFNTGYYGRYYGRHGGQKMYLTKNKRLVKPNYELYNTSHIERERAKKYKYLPNLGYMKKAFGVEPLNINTPRIKQQTYIKRTKLRRFNAPRIKQQLNVKNVNLKNYSKIYKQIRKSTNVPGAYELRKKLLSNLEKELVVYDYIAGNSFKPSETNSYYYIRYGKDPKHWLFLLPESYNMLKQRGNTFKHFILRNSVPNLRVSNFKHVKKNKRTNNK